MEDNTRVMEEEFINVTDLLLGYFSFFVKRWYLFIVLALIAALGVFVSVKKDEDEYYAATAYYTLERTGNVYTDAAIASRVANGISIIAGLQEFRKELIEEMGDNYKTGCTSRFYGSATPEANLFSVTVTTNDSEYANTILAAFEAVYPKWLHKTQGNTTITVTDEALSDGPNMYAVSLKKKIAAGGLFIFGAWFVIATLSILLSRKVQSETEIEQITGSKCLGIIPDVVKKQREKRTKDNLLVNNEHIDPGYLQSVRSLAKRVEIMLTKEDKKVLLMTSTTAEEGKSLITLNLAMILSRRGKRVVVIDADFYRSGIMRMFNFSENTQGLLDFLEKGKKRMKIFHQRNGIVIVPAGTGVSETHPYVNLKDMSTLLKVLKDKSDVILIDTPSDSVFNEGYAISELVDGVIFIVRGEYAQVRDVKKAVEPYIQNSKLCGFIMNRQNYAIAKYGFNYGYGYGYGYSKYRNYGGGRYGKYGYGYGDNSQDGFIIDDIQREGVVENYTEQLRKEQGSPVTNKK